MSAATKTRKARKPSSRVAIPVIAKQAGVPERKVRRVARKLGLSSGKGKAYGLTAAQAKRINKALTA